MEETEQNAEKLHWLHVINILQSYKSYVEKGLRRRQEHLRRLPNALASRLPEVTFEQLWAIDQAADFNQHFLSDVANFQRAHMFQDRVDSENNYRHVNITASDQHRNTAILHSLYREWSIEGKSERDSTFTPLIEQLTIHLPVDSNSCYQKKVLVPGCGLGRLPLEIAAKGYRCQGNEFSAYMVAPANYMLNQVYEAKCYKIHPWLDRICNVVKPSDVLESIQVPDVCAETLLNESLFYNLTPPQSDCDAYASTSNGSQAGFGTDSIHCSEASKKPKKMDFPKFSMCIGDFVDIYGSDDERDNWDAIATCFFLDTAPVVMDYVETIRSALLVGGIWVNMGPLLYHWTEDTDNNQDERFGKSVELSWEEVRHVIVGYGFEIVNEEWREVSYTRCLTSMMWNTFRTVFFTARKMPLNSPQLDSRLAECRSEK